MAQKGSSFSDSSNVADAIKQGYRELSYVEVPLNLRYRLTLGFIGVYGIAGVYGGYALSGKTVNEITNDIQEVAFQSSMGLRNISFTNTVVPMPSFATIRVFSINLVICSNKHSQSFGKVHHFLTTQHPSFFCNYLIFNSTSRIENQMYDHLFPLSPSCASLTGGYAYLATLWQRHILL